MRKVIYENDTINIDSGIFFGRGVFETILVKNTPVFLKEHIKRLNNAILEFNFFFSSVVNINLIFNIDSINDPATHHTKFYKIINTVFAIHLF